MRKRRKYEKRRRQKGEKELMKRGEKEGKEEKGNK